MAKIKVLTFDITPKWAGLVPWMMNVIRTPGTNNVVIATYCFEIAKLGKAAEELVLVMLDKKIKHAEYEAALMKLTAIARKADGEIAKAKRAANKKAASS